MASSSTSHSLSSIFFFLFSLITTLLHFPSPSISFDFSSFGMDDSQIDLENDFVEAGNILTLYGNLGRASYSNPIQLLDKSTGRLADFETNFSFVIKCPNYTFHCHGISFFLAPFQSKILPNSGGGYLGLMSMDVAENNFMKNKVVAVEFDTFQNSWDPSPDHVGINVNSIISVANVSLQSGSMRDGRTAYARVTYNSTTKNMIVFLSYNNSVFNHSILHHIIDLKKVLPEQIRVGFSASLGFDNLYVQYNILSWQFTSTWEHLGKETSDYYFKGKETSKSFKGKGKNTSESSKGKETNKSFKKKNRLVVALGGLIAVFGVFGSGLGLTYFWLKKRRNSRKNANPDMLMNDEFEKRTGPKRFSYRELVDATSNFDEGGKLGEGGFGSVYKGFIGDMDVAIKKISGGSQQGRKEYESEVKIISQLRHRNLVKLIGWYHKKNELLLVYELMPNRSLDKHLYRVANALPWDVRYKIAFGLASALLYLHEEWEQCVVHRDVKSSNVMLDSNFNAKLGDFGLARVIDHGLSSRTSALAGTMGYLAPECLVKFKTSKRSDIYSFGIVALEIACGRKPVDVTVGVSLVEWVRELYQRGKIIKAADERLQMNFDKQQMERLMVIGLRCAHSDPKTRPSIRQVTNFLSQESSLPDLPSNMPAPVNHMSLSMCTLASVSSAGDSRNFPTDGSQYCTCVDCTCTNLPPPATSSGGSSSTEALLHSC